MKLRVRILHGEVDPNEAQRIANGLPSFGTTADDLERAAVELEAPMKVSWRDEVGELDAIAQRVGLGEVRPTDLVNDGNGWVCVSDFPPLSEACARAPKHLLPEPELRKQMVWPAVRLVLIAIGIGVLLYVVRQLR